METNNECLINLSNISKLKLPKGKNSSQIDYIADLRYQLEKFIKKYFVDGLKTEPDLVEQFIEVQDDFQIRRYLIAVLKNSCYYFLKEYEKSDHLHAILFKLMKGATGDNLKEDKKISIALAKREAIDKFLQEKSFGELVSFYEILIKDATNEEERKRVAFFVGNSLVEVAQGNLVVQELQKLRELNDFSYNFKQRILIKLKISFAE